MRALSLGKLEGDADAVTGVDVDSRRIRPGDLFVAVSGGEVFLDVWRHPGRLNGRFSVSTWLLAIARFKAFSSLGRRPDEELDEVATTKIEDQSDDPAIALEKRDKSALIQKCLMGLSAQHREVVDLVYYQEKPVEEVAEIVGLRENTVKTRMFYARKQLAELLRAAGVERG